MNEKEFFQWQSDWNKRQEEIRQSKEKLEIKEAAKVFERAKPKHRNVKVEKVTPGQRYFQAVQEQRRVNEQERIKTIILTKKQLDTEELLKKKEPLRKLEEENEEKKRKQKLKLKESDRIFKDTVAMLFPDVVKVNHCLPQILTKIFMKTGLRKMCMISSNNLLLKHRILLKKIHSVVGLIGKVL